MQKDNQLKKTQKQKQRIQQQYNQKTDELYNSWNKVQASQSDNYQLNSQISNQLNKINEQENQMTVQQKQIAAQQIENNQLINKLKLIDQEDKKYNSCSTSLKKLNLKNQTKAIKNETIVKKMTNIIDQCQSELSLAKEETKKSLIENTTNKKIITEKKAIEKSLINQCQISLSNNQSQLKDKKELIIILNKKIAQMKNEHKNQLDSAVITTKNKMTEINNTFYLEQIEKLNQKMTQLLSQIDELSEQAISQQALFQKTLSRQALSLQALSLKAKEKAAVTIIEKSSAIELTQNNSRPVSEEEKQSLAQLKNKLNKEIAGNKINITYLEKGIIQININNDKIFGTNEVQIKNKGTKILNKVAHLLQQFPERKIQIIGHTDNIPIRSGGNGKILSNWELSAFRAAAVIRYLQHGAKVAPQRMTLLGASQYQPLEKGNKKSIREKNRRIEIQLLP